MIPDRARIMRSNVRWRVIFAVCAVVIPSALFGLFERQNRRLEALANHGQQTTAVVTQIQRAFIQYRYWIDGRGYDWSVASGEAPGVAGTRFTVTYLPQDPGLSRPGVYDAIRLGEDVSRATQLAGLSVVFAFFAGSALLCHIFLVRMRAGLDLRPTPWPAGAKGLNPLLRKRLPWMAAAILPALLLVMGLHSRDMYREGESVGTIAALMLGATAVLLVIMGAVVWWMGRPVAGIDDARSALLARGSRVPRWLPVAVGLVAALTGLLPYCAV